MLRKPKQSSEKNLLIQQPLIQPEGGIQKNSFDLKKASQIVEQFVPRKQTQKWKYEGDRLTIEDGEFDYDISALSVGEEKSGEQGI